MKIIIVSLIIAILSGMGVGGGGLLVIYLTIFENTPQIIAQGTNLIFFIAAGLASTIYNAKKEKIVWRHTIPISISSVLFAIITSILTSKISPEILGKMFGVMLVLSGSASLISRFVKNKQKENI